MNDDHRFSLAVSQIVGKRTLHKELTEKTSNKGVFLTASRLLANGITGPRP